MFPILCYCIDISFNKLRDMQEVTSFLQHGGNVDAFSQLLSRNVSSSYSTKPELGHSFIRKFKYFL